MGPAVYGQLLRLGWDEEDLLVHLRTLTPEADRILTLAREQRAALDARIAELEKTRVNPILPADHR